MGLGVMNSCMSISRLLKNTRLLRCVTLAYRKVRLIPYDLACLAFGYF